METRERLGLTTKEQRLTKTRPNEDYARVQDPGGTRRDNGTQVLVKDQDRKKEEAATYGSLLFNHYYYYSSKQQQKLKIKQKQHHEKKL